MEDMRLPHNFQMMIQLAPPLSQKVSTLTFKWIRLSLIVQGLYRIWWNLCLIIGNWFLYMLKIISSLSVVSGILHLVLFDLNLKISYVLHSFIRIIFIPLCHPPVLVVTALNGVHPTLRDYSLVIKNICFLFFWVKAGLLYKIWQSFKCC